jgi:hypothetical protein
VRISVCDSRRQTASPACGVAEKAANERGHFILSNTRHNQAVASMPEAGQIETGIACEEGRITLPAQENDNLLVLQTLPANVDSNLLRR